MVSGKVTMLIFEEDGTLQSHYDLDAEGPSKELEIPPGKFHALLLDKAPATFLEVKSEPYEPLSVNEVAPWSPEEGDGGVDKLLSQIANLAIGSKVGG